MKIIRNPFNTYRITYGIANQDTIQFKDFARIDLLLGDRKVRQVIFGSVISPGNNGGVVNGDEIHLSFPISHFQNIVEILKLGVTQPLTLYLEVDDDSNNAIMGGITTSP
jgi:hypothetical protein